MNTKMIRYILGKMLGVEALLLLLPAFVSLLYRETDGIYFLIPAAILAVVYLFTGVRKPKNPEIYGKEGMVIVASAWILWSMFGALPFTLSGSIPNYIDALFETISGFSADRCRGASAGDAVLAQLYTLGRRNGRAGICYGADIV